MFKRFIVLSLIVLAFGLLLVGCKKKSNTAADEIVIGFQGAETGPIAIYGLQTLAGVKLAVDEINDAGGLNGKTVKLIHFDSRGDKTESVSVAKRLLNANICAAVGEPTSGAYFSTRDVYERGKTSVISAGATAENVTDGKAYVFRNTLLDADGVPALVEFAINSKGYKNFALISAVNNDFSVGVAKFFRKFIPEKGGTIVAEQTISDGDTDISAQVTSFRGKQIDAIIYTGYYQEASLILLELRKQGINAPLIGADGLQSPDLWNVAKDASVGTLFYAGFAVNADIDTVKNFNKKVKSRGTEPDMFAAQGYDAANLLFEAIKVAGVTNCSDADERTKIKDALAATSGYNGVSGVMSFDKEGNAIKKPFIQEIIKTDNGYTMKLVN